MTLRQLAAGLLTSLMVAHCGYAAEKELDPAAQKLAQQAALKDAEATARRVGTAIRVLHFQKLDAAEEQKALTEVANKLKDLTQQQMTAVLDHLDKAVKAPDEATASIEQRGAYDKHRQIVTSLRGMLTKLETLKSLDHAAEKLDRLAKDQFELHLKATATNSLNQSGSRTVAKRVVDERDEQSDAQVDLRGEMTGFLTQVSGLKSKLNPEQKERLDKADVGTRSGKIIADMELAKVSLTNGDYRGGADKQLSTAKELQGLAAALRSPKDALATMKEARDKIEKLIAAEKELKKQTEDDKKFDRSQPEYTRRSTTKTDPVKEHANKLADTQAKIEFDTRDVRKLTEQVAKEVAQKLLQPEQEMKRATDELRNSQNQKAALDAETKAEKLLEEAKKELDKLIAKADAEKTDALVATKKAIEEVNKLIAEQKTAKNTTKQNENNKDALKPAADQQKQVARKAEEVKNLPLPDKQEVKDALAKAAEEAKKASDDLQNKDAKTAQPKQDETIKALEQAKKGLEEKAAEIEKRRDEIAKLEETAKKLEELAKEEKKVADKADRAADAKDKADAKDAPKAADVAKDQEKLNQPTKDAAKEAKALDPMAGEKVEEATKNQENAKDNLDKDEAKPAADEARQAARKLDEAANDLKKKADELKAKEAADQQSLQPKETDAAQAAQQIAKAIDEANKASEEAKKAAEQLGQKPMSDAKADLAKLQEQVAKKADQLQNKEAAKDAAEAAKAIEKGDIPQALEKQQQALDKLNDAAKGEPMGEGKPMKGEGEGKPMKGEGEGEGKPMGGEGQGEPKPGDAKNNGELAKAQQQLKDATQALQQSQQANQAAQAALQQAQAQSPGAVKEQLQQAQKQLGDAQKQLQEGQPGQAGEQQQQAANDLQRALDTLNQAAQAMGQQPGKPGQPQQAQAGQPMPGQGDKPGEGEGKGDKPGKGQGDKPGKPGNQPGQKPGDGEEKNEGQNATGDRTGEGKNKTTASSGVKKDGDGNFIKLQGKDRDKVTAAVEAALPAEFRELIKQYNINIKKAEKK